MNASSLTNHPIKGALEAVAAKGAETAHGMTKRVSLRGTLESVAESFLFFVSASIIVLVFLIFVFVGQKALPIFLQQATTTKEATIAPTTDWRTMPAADLAKALGLNNAEELAAFDDETIALMVATLAEEVAQSSNPDAQLNALSYRMMFKPHQWHGGQYSEPVSVWQPVGDVPKYNVVPLFLGSLKATFVALLFAVPLSLLAALYVSQFAAARTRKWIKPAIELLASLPSVVLGMFGLVVLATFLQNVFGWEARLNATLAGLTLGLAVIPMVFTVMEDVISSVPKSYREASLALGASPWQTAIRVQLPAAMPGLFAAMVLGFGRAIGETMIVLMVSGNASIMSMDLTDPIRTITATIAAELPETRFNDEHFRILFFLGAMLFSITFIANMLGDVFVTRLKHKLEGTR